MKVMILTVHRTLNYGSVLQTYACCKIFDNLACKAVVADYARPNDYNKSSLSTLGNYTKQRLHNKNCKSPLKYVKSVLAAVATYPYTKKFFKNCDSFLDSHVTLSPQISKIEELECLAEEFEVLCAGSDQIWNSEYNDGTDKVYLLGFGSEKHVKLSLSSSIGKESLTLEDAENFRKYLTGYKAVSVREDRAKELLGEIGIKAKHLLDPTLWHDKNFWIQEAGPIKIEEPYLLLYKLKADNLIDNIAEQMAEKLGIKIVRICFSPKHKRNNKEICITLPSVDEFLSLILHADYVVTNSFHGTCFSLNFNKEFISVARGKYNSRIESILKELNLDKRFVKSEEDFIALENSLGVDYNVVNKVLQEKRKEAYAWLRDAID